MVFILIKSPASIKMCCSQYFLLTTFTVLVCSSSCLADDLHSGYNPNALRFNSGRQLWRENSAKTSKPRRQIVNVDKFRAAKSDGADDTQAFAKAWKIACSTKRSIFLVPARKVYHLKQITFDGPCQYGITIMIRGSIRASTKRSDYVNNPREWIKFKNLHDFTVDGRGVIIGNGQVWWPKSCKIDKSQPCVGAPTAVTFHKCKNVKVSHIKLKNAQQMHMNISECVNVEASHLKIKSKGTSPNTDGIHVTGSTNVQILNSHIATGDDCISIVNGASNVRVRGIKCGPGHGISIGSLGKDGNEDRVSNIFVSGVVFTGTTNGVRIKTWQGGRGFAKNIVFQNIQMRNVTNPIIIDQFYCDRNGEECPMQKNAVHVKNVLYKNIIGTSSSEEGIIFKCSDEHSCEGVKMQNVEIKYNGRSSNASCSNVNVGESGRITPQCPKY